MAADDDAWSLLTLLLEWLEDGWRQSDRGIWEARGPRRHVTHSKVVAWVAFDRAVRFHERDERSFTTAANLGACGTAWDPTSVRSPITEVVRPRPA